MIHRFLVITSKRLFFSTNKADFEDKSKFVLINLKMPLDVFHKAEEKLKDLDYRSTTNILPSELKSAFKELFQDLSKFALNEKDRVWLFEQSKK